VYCLANERQVANGLSCGGYNVEHFKPSSKFPALEREYSNLLWSCPSCNSAKGGHWPTPHQLERGERWLDPTTDNMGEHLRVNGDQVEPCSPTGAWFIRRLQLNGDLQTWRRRRLAASRTRLEQLRAVQLRLSGGAADEILSAIESLRSELDAEPWDRETDCRCSKTQPTPPSPRSKSDRQLQRSVATERVVMRNAEGREVVKALRARLRPPKRYTRKYIP
jgi:hypothetical protein